VRACSAPRHGRQTGPAVSRTSEPAWTGLGASANSSPAELAGLDGLLGALDAAAERLPGDSEVVSAVLRARDAPGLPRTPSWRQKAAEQDERTARSAADTAAADAAAHCDEHGLPRGSGDVEEVRGR